MDKRTTDRLMLAVVVVVPTAAILGGVLIKPIQSAQHSRQRAAVYKAVKGEWVVLVGEKSVGLSIGANREATFGESAGDWTTANTNKAFTFKERKPGFVSDQQRKYGVPVDGKAVFEIEGPTQLRWVLKKDGRSVLECLAQKVKSLK